MAVSVVPLEMPVLQIWLMFLIMALGRWQTLSTKAIQAAIDKCAKQDGGTVYCPPGNYLSGSLHLNKQHNILP